ncbi:MAG: disulfide bond formation protein B, partial [Pseudomonadota bacterium]|nr:disulfide bond formation protein B [Pseudomonadota bacterium]
MNDRMATLPAKRADRSAAWWLAVCCVLSAASIAVALLTQHRFGMDPCSWCVLQRAIFALVSLIALLGLVARTRWAHRAASLLSVCLCACGLAAAAWQYFVASHSESCNLTLADRLLTGAR